METPALALAGAGVLFVSPTAPYPKPKIPYYFSCPNPRPLPPPLRKWELLE